MGKRIKITLEISEYAASLLLGTAAHEARLMHRAHRFIEAGAPNAEPFSRQLTAWQELLEAIRAGITEAKGE